MRKLRIPHNLEAEQAVLGSILLNDKAVETARDRLNPEDFYHPAHQIVFTAMLRLAQRKQPVDLITLPSQIKEFQSDDPLNPANLLTDLYLTNLLEAPSSSANITYYADLVKQSATRRLIMQRAKEAYFTARDNPDGLDVLAAGNGHYHLSEYARAPMKSETRLPILTLGDFLATVGDPPPMLVEQLLPEKSLILLSGKPKHLKSFMAIDILEAVCLGQQVFNVYQTNRSGPVVYMAMEDGPYEIANRLLKRGHKPGTELPFHICHQRLLLSDPQVFDRFRAEMEALQPVLICIDTKREGLGVRDENDATEVSDKIRPLREMCRELCTILLNTHNRKDIPESSGDEIAGTNALTSSVDGWLSVQKKAVLPNGNVRLSYAREGRAIRGKATVEMDTQTLRFVEISEEEIARQKAEEAEQARQSERDSLMQRIRQAIKGKATVQEIAATLEMDQKAIYPVVKDLVKKGYLRDTGEKRQAGGSGRGAALYETTDIFLFSETPLDNRATPKKEKKLFDEISEPDPYDTENDPPTETDLRVFTE